MVDFPRFEAHPVDLPDATEMPPHADAGEWLRGMEIRFHEEVRGPESVAFDSRGRGPYTGVVDGRVLVFFPSTTQGEFGRHQIMEMTGLPARDLRVLDPLLSYLSTILGRDRTVVVNLEHVKAIVTAAEVFVRDPSNTRLRPFLQELLVCLALPIIDLYVVFAVALPWFRTIRLVWSFWTDDKAGVSS
ncbi:hypothetical protein ZWY2020_036147 [Hordeum vulgare]|nr:hypothetical protein ZWY2020_036147 [Hordeum vulgare]